PPLEMDIAIQALLASIVGASHGWPCSWAVSVRSVFGWLSVRCGWLCNGFHRVGHMAARDHTHPDDCTDRRLWPLDTGLRRLEVKAHAKLANCSPVYYRRNGWRSPRDDAAHLCQSGLFAWRGRDAAGHLQHLRPGQAGVQTTKSGG